MKKHLLLLSLAFLTITGFGQSSIPNGDFETWNSATYNYPKGYLYSSNSDNFFSYNLPFNVTKTTDAYHGTYAVQVSSAANAKDTAFGYFLNANPNSNNGPSSWTGGMAYSQKPLGIRGYYKYNTTVASATIIIVFSKAGVNIGTYAYLIGGVQNSYKLFHFTFTPPLSQTPDSVIFAAASNNVMGQQTSAIAGCTLKIDSVSFTGVTAQPDSMNGDFETWESQNIETPVSWYVESSNGTGFNRTTDAAKGNYAIELKTYLGNQNNHAAAQSVDLATGFYSKNCNQCVEQGGYPFSNQVDTLAFYYKYTPSGNDSAMVNLNFKKNGSSFQWAGAFLHSTVTTGTYIYKEIPFNTGQAPDTVIIDILSSAWQDTLFSFIGSDLKIDEVHFKSQSHTGILNYKDNKTINIFPNPASEIITIENTNALEQTYLVSIENVQGQEVLRKKINFAETHSIDIRSLSNGVYMVTIKSKDLIKYQKLIIQR